VSPILILTAVELEARRLARDLEFPPLPAFPFPAFGRRDVRVAPVGLRASLCARRWPRLLNGLDRPLVVSAGVCGGLDPRLGMGDLVVPGLVIGASGDEYKVATGPHRVLAAALARVCTGALVTAGDLVPTPGAKAALFRATGAAAVDMESAPIMAAAAAAGLPALVIRAVSDAAGQPVPLELARLVTTDGRLRLGPALALMVTRPATLPEALDLRRRAHHALAAVARALSALIG
jgi:adenosylhomocysteine nucleosidase